MEEILNTTIFLFAEAWEWIREHGAEIMVFVLLFGVVYFGYYLLFVRVPQVRQQEIELCQRAFEYTAEQCEFIVRNRVMPR